MSELRKPCFTFLLKRTGKKCNKLELFDAEQWRGKADIPRRGTLYRIRVNGKWFPAKEVKFFDKWKVRDLIWRSIPLNRA